MYELNKKSELQIVFNEIVQKNIIKFCYKQQQNHTI